ncbi:hypothetical protein AK812_SmicGene36237 [Symbiodinium microadriaticum]|uniref:DUF202 domain-containing protein n=1 Tax=Symbiodinium microadriaticum TaxID=2951 RepID=A0A1Q9CJF8_SYMMI|nr:hypothetical protein AK812_SmicGene36237 [Symbiodinium microadriaticum]
MFAWETDRAAMAVAKAQLPGLSCRGDLNDDDPAKVRDGEGRSLGTSSRVTDGPGHHGDRGGLFLQTVEFMSEVRRLVAPRRFGFIFENVEMATADAKQITEALGAAPLWVDAADFGWVGRPRLWWLSADWARMTLDLETGEPLQWTRRGQWDRLRVEEARRPVEALDMGDLTFDDSVLSGRRRLPCFTTPALDENGRAAPKGCRDKIPSDAQQRWSADRNSCTMPADFTWGPGAAPLDDRTRHRLIGNGWHWGVARRLLLILLVATALQTSDARPQGEPPRSTISWVTSLWQFGGPVMGPAPGEDTLDPLVDLDEESHWRASAVIPHPFQARPRLEPAWEEVLNIRRRWRHDLARIRREVLQEVKIMVDDHAEQTTEWMSQRSAAVKATYSTPDKPAVTQIPVLLELLRTDDRYKHPASMEELRRVNADYVRQRVATARVGEHTETLLQELIDEVKLGRVVGPTRAPAWLKARAVALPWRDGVAHLVEPPPGEVFLAASFAIVQIDEHGNIKIRRGEDWRRSGHNSTVAADDVPTHHFLGSFVDLARRMAGDGVVLIFGHDLLNAYRLWPVRCPAHCGTFLPTAAGMTFWYHLAMNFGATASVWNFNRGGDALQQLLRGLLLLPTGHYVDDFNGLELEELGQSAMEAFEQLFAALGFRIKVSKSQPAAAQHIVQGVLFEISRRGVTLSPTPERVRRIMAQITQALQTDAMKPDEAHKLAGRLSFLTQAVFGGVGKAPIKAVYARAADTAAHSNDGLSGGLRAALHSLEKILPTIRPRFIPFNPDDMDTAVLYADAFFLDGEQRHKAGHVPTTASAAAPNRANNGWGFVLRLGGMVFYDHGVVPPWFLRKFESRRAFIYMLEVFAQVAALAAFATHLPGAVTAFIDNTAGQAALSKGYGKAGHVPTTASAAAPNRANNGWGFVLRLGGMVFYDHGVVPPWFLRKFESRRAFIYMLEVFAQVAALAAFATHLPGAVTAFIDNTAGQAALSKGYGKDPAMNGMLAAFWALAARRGTMLDFRRVPSKANVADAVSRDDFGRAWREGWTRVHIPASPIMHILAKAVDDLLYAVDGAAADLLACSSEWSGEPALGGAVCRLQKHQRSLSRCQCRHLWHSAPKAAVPWEAWGRCRFGSRSGVKDSTGSFVSEPIDTKQLSIDLANERTLLAWVRTGLAAIRTVFSFATLSGLTKGELVVDVFVTLVLSCSGLATLLIGWTRFIAVRKGAPGSRRVAIGPLYTAFVLVAAICLLGSLWRQPKRLQLQEAVHGQFSWAAEGAWNLVFG